MKNIIANTGHTIKLFCLIIFFIVPSGVLEAGDIKPPYRVIIMTDMTHDDGNSLIRYFYYLPYFDTEAIIITPQLPDYNFNHNEPWQKGTAILEAYANEYNALKKHDARFPDPAALKAVTKRGRGALPIIWLTNEKKFAKEIAGRYVETSWGDIRYEDWIGEGKNPNGESKDSEGSEFLQQVFDKDDDRPIFVELWGGPVALVQALFRYHQRQGEEKFTKLLAKLHIYGILLQDITADYFVDLDKIQALKCTNLGTVTSSYSGKRVAPGWLLHDGGHFWKYITVMKQSEVNGHGPMSDLYDHGGEGDTPSFLYLLSGVFGLNDPLDPTQGSWGSRFVQMDDTFPSNYFHTCGVERSELERWVPQAKNNFLNRLNYSKNSPEKVNHEPKAVINDWVGNSIIEMKGIPGKSIKLDASNSTDSDNHALTFRWFYYKEASSYTGDVSITDATNKVQTLVVPKDIGNGKIHIILEVTDNGTPALVAYRRVIISKK